MAAPPIDPKLLGELAVVIIKAVSLQTSREQLSLPYKRANLSSPHVAVDVLSSTVGFKLTRKTCQIEAR
jgi:hypothetical protein